MPEIIMPEVGQPAPPIDATTTGGAPVPPADHVGSRVVVGKWVVVYFYPRANTPG